ncbi:MAG: phenylalanine--tRNA ligase subunit beta [Candidatus Brocadiia bacterium]
MKVTYHWLKELCPSTMSPDDVAAALPRVGLGVEGVERFDDDTVYELEVTANRADWMSAFGVARELAAISGVSTRLPGLKRPPEGAGVASITSVVVENPDLCPLYIARVVTGAKACESPAWLRRRIELLGLRPVNAVVDITNYLLYETGQPLHAFDLDRLNERRIVVRNARPGEKMSLINGKEVALDPSMLVIADAAKPVAIAGVMGGLATEVTSSTKAILIECAAFNGVSIRKTSRKIGVSSDASSRFERGTDIAGASYVAARAVEMIREICGGEIAGGAISVGSDLPEPRRVSLRPARMEKLLGIRIDDQLAKKILENLGFALAESVPDSMSWLVPSWRKDVSREVDLIEEVARIYGYDKIPDRVSKNVHTDPIQPEYLKRAALREILLRTGMSEAFCDPFIEPSLASSFPSFPFKSLVELRNPIRSDQGVMRTSSVPSLMKSLKGNRDRGLSKVNLFEFGRICMDQGGPAPDEHQVLGLLWDLDFAAAKGMLECALHAYAPHLNVSMAPVARKALSAGHSLAIRLGGAEIGFFGTASEDVASAIGLKFLPVVAEVNLDLLYALPDRGLRFFDNSRIPKFPSVDRDFAFVVNESETWARVYEVISGASKGSPVEDIQFFDLYRGKQVPAGKKSIALRVVFRAPDHTLTEDEVSPASAAIVEAMTMHFGASLRQS